jgi:hypothetical protein
MAIRLIVSLLWYYDIHVTIITSRFLELGSLAMFACFAIATIIALGKVAQTPSTNK